MKNPATSIRESRRFVERFLYRPRMYDRISLALLIGGGIGYMMLLGGMSYLIARYGDPRQHMIITGAPASLSNWLARLFWVPFVLLEISIALGILTNPASIMLRELMRAQENGLLAQVRVSAITAGEIADAIVAKTARFTFGAWLLYAGAVGAAGAIYILGPHNTTLVESRLYRGIANPRTLQAIQLAGVALVPIAVAVPLCVYFSYLSIRLRIRNPSYFAYFPKLIFSIPLRTLFFYTFGIAAGLAFFQSPLTLDSDWYSLMPNDITINWKFLATVQSLALAMIFVYTMLERRQAIIVIHRMEF